MTIKQIDVYSVVLRFQEPLKLAHGTCFESKNIIVKVFTDDEHIGIGEASPAAHESNKTILKALERIVPHLKDADNLEIGTIIEKIDAVVSGNPSAKAAIDIALHDILGQRMKKPIFGLLGEFREVETDLTLSSGKPSEIAQDAFNAAKAGFKALKLKVGFSPDEDFERIRAVRTSVGPDIALRIDANQGWTVSQAIKMLRKLEPLNLEFVEQPVKADDIKGLREVKQNSPIQVMADESVCSPEDAMRLINIDAVDLINIKLMKCGGIQKAKKIASMAELANIPCMAGCMPESTIGITAAVHAAAALSNVKYADLDSDILLMDKLVLEGGAELKSSKRIPPSEPGLGIAKLNEKLLGAPVRKYFLH